LARRTDRPSAAPTPAPEPPPAEPFALNLYRDGDFVRQYTFEWCVGASLPMALNMIRPEDEATRARQRQLWETARDRSNSPFGGASPLGWVAALNDLGAGPYRLISVPTLDKALLVGGQAIAETGKPVGLVMWRGRHAWVMSGFTSIGDPRIHPDAEITGVHVLDPLYPHGSRRWGPSPTPNALLTPATLGEQFVARDGGVVDLGVPPGYILVLPVAVGA